MPIIDAFVSHPDSLFMCKWAIEFGDPRMMSALAEKHPQTFVKVAIELGRVSWMMGVVKMCGVGLKEFQEHVLTDGSVDQVLDAEHTGMVDAETAKKHLHIMAKNDKMAEEMLEILLRKKCLLLEEAVVSTGDVSKIKKASLTKWCELAKRLMNELENCEHVMQA